MNHMDISHVNPSFRPGRRSRDLSAHGMSTCGVLLALLLALLLGCGGAAGDAEAPPPSERLPELVGVVTDGLLPTDVRDLQVTIKGSVGAPRTAEGRGAPVDGHDYQASLVQLSGPYLLSNARNAKGAVLFSVAAGPGVANLTPLTTLLVAQLLGTEPRPYFDGLGVGGGFTAADDAAIATAEQRVRRYLQREHGFEIPAGIGSFVTSKFVRVAGDPMFDTVTALVERIGTQGDFSPVVTAIAQESARCRTEELSVVGDSGTDAFCPLSKSTAADPDDATVQVAAFINRHGDRLTVRLRDTVVVSVRLAGAEGAQSACDGAACTGVRVGTRGDAQTQALDFTAARLSGAGGDVTLTGSLRTAAPGIALPGLPCTTNRFYLIDEAAGRADGYCGTPDDFGLGGSGQSLASGSSRRSYTFNDGAGGPWLQVMTQGRDVVTALVYDVDPNTGLENPRFMCRNAGCAGISLGATTLDTSLGVPIVKQPIRLARAMLLAVQPDGTLSSTVSLKIEGEFTGLYVNDTSVPPLLPLPCAATGLSRVDIVLSEQPDPLAVCEPDDLQGNQLRFTSTDNAGNLVLSMASLLSDGAGGLAVANTVAVTVSPTGEVMSAFFDPLAGPRYTCSGAACAGITVTAPNAAGERTVSYGGVTLTEIGIGGLAGDRAAVLNGRFIAPALP